MRLECSGWTFRNAYRKTTKNPEKRAPNEKKPGGQRPPGGVLKLSCGIIAKRYRLYGDNLVEPVVKLQPASTLVPTIPKAPASASAAIRASS